LKCRTLQGTGGVFIANGGMGGSTVGGGGSGGRIAIWRTIHQASGTTVQVNGGTGYPDPSDYGEDGTIVWGLYPASRIVFSFR
jgi:hypothetical protein